MIDGIEKVIADDRKGRKNKKGFYDYKGKSKGKEVDQSIYPLMQVDNPGSKHYPADEIAERVILCMLNEAAYCLEEGILRNVRDGDIGAIFGLGFPPFLGGPFRYMETLGVDNVVAKLSALQEQHGERFTPAPSLVSLAKEGKNFY